MRNIALYSVRTTIVPTNKCASNLMLNNIYFQVFESVNKMVEYHQNKALRLMDREGNVHGETNLSKYPTISNC